jgi:hypothetical protein
MFGPEEVKIKYCAYISESSSCKKLKKIDKFSE